MHGVFIDLSQVFDSIDHSILLKLWSGIKLLYDITDRHHGCVKSYLLNRRQFIQINKNKNTSLEVVSCGVPQGSILGVL